MPPNATGKSIVEYTKGLGNQPSSINHEDAIGLVEVQSGKTSD